jgi:hypothetical protein
MRLKRLFKIVILGVAVSANNRADEDSRSTPRPDVEIVRAAMQNGVDFLLRQGLPETQEEYAEVEPEKRVRKKGQPKQKKEKRVSPNRKKGSAQTFKHFEGKKEKRVSPNI